MLNGYISQYWQIYNTFDVDSITHYMHQVACIYIVVTQQKWNFTYSRTTYKKEVTKFANICFQDVKLAKTKKS